MHPTIQEIEDYLALIDQYKIDTKDWADKAIDDINNNRAIGGNPPSPPPPPPGTHH